MQSVAAFFVLDNEYDGSCVDEVRCLFLSQKKD